MKDKLFSRDFSLLVIGQIVSILGSAVLRFALNLYILDLTGRADIFGLLIAVSAIPAILFTPLGGAIADRFSRCLEKTVDGVGDVRLCTNTYPCTYFSLNRKY